MIGCLPAFQISLPVVKLIDQTEYLQGLACSPLWQLHNLEAEMLRHADVPAEHQVHLTVDYSNHPQPKHRVSKGQGFRLR